MSKSVFAVDVRRLRRPIISIVLLLLAASPGFAQFSWDASHTNLQVLPDTISGEDLRATMISFTSGLGVRCNFCHDDTNGSQLSEMDFASDAKPEKEIARLMMRMVDLINSDYIVKVSHAENPDQPEVPVSCVTCHRGVTHPQSLEDVLLSTISSHGSAAGREKYQELRDEHYGRMAYDFSPLPLARVGSQLQEQGKTEEAIDVYRLAVEMHPDNWHVYDNLAGAYLAAGDTVRAVAFYQKCLQLEPGIERVAEQLAALR